MNNNTQLIHYLNSDLKVQHNGYIDNLNLYNYPQVANEYSTAKLFMYPLFCLTETINHYGVEQIPIVELAKIEGTYKGEARTCHENFIKWKSTSLKYIFGYTSDNSFYLSCSIFGIKRIYNQLPLFNYLDKICINHRGIENTIDPRSLGYENPYLIKK